MMGYVATAFMVQTHPWSQAIEGKYPRTGGREMED
jgi:hypothetical protein